MIVDNAKKAKSKEMKKNKKPKLSFEQKNFAVLLKRSC